MTPESHSKYLEAWKLADEGKFFEAIELISNAIELSPKSSVLWVTKAQFFADVNETDAAIDCARKSIRLNSRNHHALVLLGLVYKRDGSQDQAIEFYKKALSVKRDHGTLTLLALAELEENPHDAAGHAAEALELQPDWDEARDVLQRATEILSRETR